MWLFHEPERFSKLLVYLLDTLWAQGPSCSLAACQRGSHVQLLSKGISSLP